MAADLVRGRFSLTPLSLTSIQLSCFFRGASCGAKACGARLHSKPHNKPRKKIAPQISRFRLPNSSQPLRRFLPGHIMIEMSYSDVIKNIAIMIWLGTKRRSELGGIWESKLRNLQGNFFCGTSCGASCGAEPYKLLPRKKPRERKRAPNTMCPCAY